MLAQMQIEEGEALLLNHAVWVLKPLFHRVKWFHEAVTPGCKVKPRANQQTVLLRRRMRERAKPLVRLVDVARIVDIPPTGDVERGNSNPTEVNGRLGLLPHRGWARDEERVGQWRRSVPDDTQRGDTLVAQHTARVVLII